MMYEIQVLKKYIVEAKDVSQTLESSKNNNEQLLRILEIETAQA